jgi:hypothetical protein
MVDYGAYLLPALFALRLSPGVGLLAAAPAIWIPRLVVYSDNDQPPRTNAIVNAIRVSAHRPFPHVSVFQGKAIWCSRRLREDGLHGGGEIGAQSRASLLVPSHRSVKVRQR